MARGLTSHPMDGTIEEVRGAHALLASTLIVLHEIDLVVEHIAAEIDA